MRRVAMLAVLLAVPLPVSAATHWEAPTTPAIQGVDGYVRIPNAAVMPRGSHVYRAVYDATRSADRPSQVVPALNLAGSELNVLVGAGLTQKNARFAVVFHGDALDAVLDNPHYRAKHHVANPNL